MVRRLALIESLRSIRSPFEGQQEQDPGRESHQLLTEIVMEGVLTSPTLNDTEKDFIVRVGLMEERWDTILTQYGLNNAYVSNVRFQNGFSVHPLETRFLCYRRMIMALLRTSRKFENLPESSRQRLKAMILQTQTKDQLDDLLGRVLRRTCGIEVHSRVVEDVASLRFHRLLWKDRFDCTEETSPLLVTTDDENEDNRKMPYLSAGSLSTEKLLYGKILLPGEVESVDSCPISLDPVQAPALQLSCDHVFCGRCIRGWIAREREGSSSKWHCPLCRNEFP